MTLDKMANAGRMWTTVHSEQDILSLLAEGDRTATMRVYKQHSPTITHWVKQNGGDSTDAEDVYQEAMIILFEKAQSTEFRLTCKIGTYLFAISKHLWYKRLTKAGQMPVKPFDQNEDDTTNEKIYDDEINIHHERELHYEQLTIAMNKIGEPCQSLLKAFYNEGKSMTEIAQIFHYTNPDNAKTQKYKCLGRLKKIFFSQEQNA